MIKLLIGGSPCTYWSIAQKNNRETEPSGMGWELFENYLIAKEKFQPDIFLYENNKSAAQPIKDEIKKRFNVWDGTLLTPDSGARYIEINSALVSAQNRQRFYVHNCGEVEQPEDRGILLRDILESGTGWTDKSYAGTTRDSGAIPEDTLKRKRHTMVAEPVRIPEYSSDKARPLNASYKNKGSGEGSLASDCFPDNPNKQVFDYIAEPVCVQEQVFGRRANDNGEYDRRYEARLDGKSGSLTGTNRQNAIAEPVNVTKDGKAKALRASADKDGIRNFVGNENDKRTCVAEPVRIGTYPSEAKNKESKQYRIYDVNGKSTTLCGEGGGMGAKTGLYAIPVYYGAEAVEFDESGKPTKARSYADGKIYAVYEVKNGKITIKDKQYPIKLADGFYIIRKLTVTECCRLQTMPDDYCRAVSASQAYKGLGNGWTAEVIIHILSHALKDIPRDEKILVLSMYDGIGTGRYCLAQMGFTNVEYHAYEIDKYAMQIAMSNYPDIIQHGDAFAVREEGWTL